ncbi:serine/threonine protein phosphatase [Canna indica]|uniref:Serine/threonine-protein phosphatase 2A 55 kDa regulatory subunit B n=1 Tax=Canna indica TaxID=4628 RepID=A0AAQ3KI54_9LILI|nr:serine/threonine protein phosphatase [Canna indica]
MYLEKAKFYSHEFEVDFTTNMDIPEGIKKIKWCQTANHAFFLLSTNDKTIKHWKVQEKKVKKVSQMNVNALNDVQNDCVASTSMHNPGGCSGRPYNYLCSPPGGFPSLRLPVVETGQRAVPMVTCRRVYANAHSFGINSISNNSDGETFISADEIRINLWNFEINNQTFNIVLVKPENILNEVITSAEFHPTHCNMLAYSSSKGLIRLIDLRQSALCDNHSKMFGGISPTYMPNNTTICSISDIKFAKDGRHILSRDYMTLKLWDLNMESGPVFTFQVHDYLWSKMTDLLMDGSVYDNFDCCQSGDGMRAATGSYNNIFRVFDYTTGSNEVTTLEASFNPMRYNC